MAERRFLCDDPLNLRPVPTTFTLNGINKAGDPTTRYRPPPLMRRGFTNQVEDDLIEVLDTCRHIAYMRRLQELRLEGKYDAVLIEIALKDAGLARENQILGNLWPLEVMPCSRTTR